MSSVQVYPRSLEQRAPLEAASLWCFCTAGFGWETWRISVPLCTTTERMLGTFLKDERP